MVAMMARAWSARSTSSEVLPATWKTAMPEDSSSDIGVSTRTPGIAARPRSSWLASACGRACTCDLPMARWKSKAGARAQRCSNEWKSPGVILRPGVCRTGVEKLGTVGRHCSQACGGAQMMPVPRGPKSHL